MPPRRLLPSELRRPGGVLPGTELLRPAGLCPGVPAGLLPAADLLCAGRPGLLRSGSVLPAAGVLPCCSELLRPLCADLLRSGRLCPGVLCAGRLCSGLRHGLCPVAWLLPAEEARLPEPAVRLLPAGSGTWLPQRQLLPRAELLRSDVRRPRRLLLSGNGTGLPRLMKA